MIDYGKSAPYLGYNYCKMRNWSVNEEVLREDPKQYRLWRLEQLINYGLDGEKINAVELRRALPELTIDPAKKSYLQFLLSPR